MCEVVATFLDLDTGESFEKGTFMFTGNSFNFTTTEEMDNRRYNVTITASNSAGSAVSSTVLSEAICWVKKNVYVPL